MGARYIILVFALCLFTTSGAQTLTCNEKVLTLHNLVKSNKLSDAYIAWSERGKCVFDSEESYFDVEKVLIYQIEASKDEKPKLIETLIAHYDNDDKIRPGNSHANRIKKAMLMHKHKKAGDDDVFTLLDTSFKNDKASFTDVKALFTYFTLYIDRYKSGKHKITDQEVLAKNDEITSILRQASGPQDISRNVNSALNGMRAMMSTIATCEKLSPYYKSAFDSKKDDALWLESTATTLFSKNCTTDSIFLVIATRLHSVKPTSKSAYYMGTAYMRTRKPAQAVAYYKVSAELETNPSEKAKTLHMIASSLLSSDKAMALDYAKQSLAVKPDFAKAHLLMAQIYAASEECGKTPFEKKSVYYLASRAALKAAEADPAFKTTAERQSEMFLKKAPTSDEIAAAKMAGQKITYDCWIKDSLIIPKS